MTLSPGTRLGPYEIVAPIGAGGMGEVYRARDTRLQRDVALKLLPRASGADADAQPRLMREARTAASLNHPQICTVHDVGEQDGVPFLAMELVDGEPLHHAIRRGRFTPERVCRIGRELADALEYAHVHHVIHRDFKSANVILTPEGHAKVVDFGIAVRTVMPSGQTGTVAIHAPADRIAGTLGYMAPELLQGAPATIRSDIWALGVVLYEMVAGRTPFDRQTDSELIAAIQRDAPGPLPSGTPPGVARIIERCLAKDPLERPARAGEVSVALDVAQPRPSGEIAIESSASGGRRRTIALVAGLLVTAAAGGWLAIAKRAPSGPAVLHFANPTQITTAVGVEDFPAWSPDGRMIAYAADPSGDPGSPSWDIWVTQLGGGAPINRTADYHGTDLLPSWSPDGSQIAFWSDRDGGGCYVMPALAGAARRIAAASILDPNPPQWSADGSELGCVAGPRTALKLVFVSTSTGQVTREIELPGAFGRSFVTLSRQGDQLVAVESTAGMSGDVNRLWLADVRSKRSAPLTDGRSRVTSPSWSADGRTLYYVANSGATMDLWAQSIGGGGIALGPPRVLTAGLGIRNAAFSADGRRFAYSQGRKVANVWRFALRSDRPATWSDVQQITFDQAYIEAMDLNRAGTELAVSSDRGGSIDLWTLPAGGGEMHQLTTDPSAEWSPKWSPDGSTIAFYAYRTGNREVWTIPASGGEWRQITNNPGVDMRQSWSADGKELLFLSNRGDWTGIYAVHTDRSGGRKLLEDPSFDARWSPVDRRVAYGEGHDLWVRADDGRGAKTRVSGNFRPGGLTWTADGRQIIFFDAGPHAGLSIANADGTGQERELFDPTGRRGALGAYDAPTDGKYVYFTWNEDLGDLWTMTVER